MELPTLPQAAYSLDLSDGFPTVAYSAQQMYDFANAALAVPAVQAEPKHRDVYQAWVDAHEVDGIKHDAVSFERGYEYGLAAAPLAEQAARSADAVAWRHVANEWADMATNAVQHLRNVRDGITTSVAALNNLKECFAHCTEVQSAAAAKPYSRDPDMDGMLPTPPAAQSAEPCSICEGDPARCDIHDCGEAHRSPTMTDHDDLHRLALDYRTARAHTETVAAWRALEHYVQEQMQRSYEAGRAYEAGLRDGRALMRGVGKSETG